MVADGVAGTFCFPSFPLHFAKIWGQKFRSNKMQKSVAPSEPRPRDLFNCRGAMPSDPTCQRNFIFIAGTRPACT